MWHGGVTLLCLLLPSLRAKPLGENRMPRRGVRRGKIALRHVSIHGSGAYGSHAPLPPTSAASSSRLSIVLRDTQTAAQTALCMAGELLHPPN